MQSSCLYLSISRVAFAPTEPDPAPALPETKQNFFHGVELPMKSPRSKVFPAMLDTHSTTFTKQNLAGWPLMPGLNRMRRRFGSRMRSGQSPGSNLATLQTSWNPSHTLRSLQAHRWSFWDGQYLLLAILGIFSLVVIEQPGPLVKTLISTLLMLSLIFPITRQFFLPFFPIVSWLILFYSSRYVDPF